MYLTTVRAAAITHVVPHTFYQGEYPMEPLGDGSHEGFQVRTAVHLWAVHAGSGTVTVSGEWGESKAQGVTLKPGDNMVTVPLTASASQVKLWWPNGMGEQPLYGINASFAGGGATLEASRR